MTLGQRTLLIPITQQQIKQRRSIFSAQYLILGKITEDI